MLWVSLPTCSLRLGPTLRSRQTTVSRSGLGLWGMTRTGRVDAKVESVSEAVWTEKHDFSSGSVTGTVDVDGSLY